ncbi:hypothetical protein F7725_008814 [Dissostichus mawsoni]|uniref:Ankyrin repeat domain 9 n=1 Tax=Dissostichus mawsoni TaxID=36200 RepID=A0A7J5Y9L2_DISMA|nr:hypothetical protein F7725_008814 [Dissostichus mawsoni]
MRLRTEVRLRDTNCDCRTSTSPPGVTMPWLVSSQVDFLSSSPSQRECERTSFSFYCSEQRSMETFSWEDGPRGFLPAEALLYAVVHDHQDYASFLLHHFSVCALRAPPCSFCCCSGGAPHLSVAVRYDRLHILALMLEALKDCSERRDFLDGCAGCSHAADAGKSLEAALQRLSSASELSSCEASELRQVQALHGLPAALPPLAPPALLPSGRAAALAMPLGNEVFRWLSGLAPPPLLLQALRCLARSGPGQISALPDFLQQHSWQ